MSLSAYGVLVGRPVESRRERGSSSPHHQVLVTDEAGTRYRVAVNVRSQESPSELLHLAVEGFAHPVLSGLSAVPPGWTPLPRRTGLPNLDLVRGDLLDRSDMRRLPPDAPGPDDDLADVLDHHLREAVQDTGARVCVFGQRWGPEVHERDPVFGFTPGNGAHDVHMNQGNSRAFRRDDGVWQDGALLLHLASRDLWVAVFLAFQSQSWRTDDRTGHALEAAWPATTPARPHRAPAVQEMS
jgi:uncharacterized protein YukJ